MALRLFVDFDGTVTTEDVGNLFFREFGGPACDDYIHDYREGRTSAQECFRKETEAIGRLPVRRAEEFLRQRIVTPGFSDFLDFCRSRDIQVRILSDGLDYYIGSILAHQGLRYVPFTANAFTVGPQGLDGCAEISIAFPYDDTECDRCACCKRNCVVAGSGEDDIVGYIGDGFSDRCAAQYADIVFAKGELQTYCQENNISYYIYASFHDVIGRLDTLLGAKRLRKRRRAEMRRRELIMREP